MTVYLGLAATAFLLVMLHPSNEEDVPKEPSAGARPASQGALQVCLALCKWPCRAPAMLTRQRMAVAIACKLVSLH